MMDTVALEQSVRVCRSIPAIIIPSELHIHISFICQWRYIIIDVQNTFLLHSKHAASADRPVNAALRKSRCCPQHSYLQLTHFEQNAEILNAVACGVTKQSLL
jgi:hypothetical protein